MKRWLALPILLVACGGGYQVAPTRMADRERPALAPKTWGPVATLPDPRQRAIGVTFTRPKATTNRLSNGVRVVYLERHDLPIVAVTVAIARGMLDESPGVMEILFDRLVTGSRLRKPKLWEYFGWLGARANPFVEPELAGITFETLSNHTASVVLTGGEMFASPDFDSEEVDEAKHETVASLRSWRAHVDDAATQNALATLGLSHRPDPDAVSAVKPADLERAYKSLVAPDALVVAVVGDIDPARGQTMLEKAFGSLKGTAKPALHATSAATADKFVLVDRAKGEQSAIVVVTPAPRLGEPDAAAFRLICGVLKIRLEDETRMAKGYTYGGDVTCTGFEPFMKLTVDVAASRTKEALADVLGVIQSLRSAPPNATELGPARHVLARTFTARFRSNAEASKELARAIAGGMPPDALGALYEQTVGVKPEEAAAAAQKWMADPHVVVLGDATAITGDISSVGLGQPIVRSMP